MTDPPSAEFSFGGRLSLDLTWTVRYRAVWPTELLVNPDDLRRWLEAVGLPAPEAPTEADLRRTRELREAIYHGAAALVGGDLVGAETAAVINRWAAEPTPYPILGPDGTAQVDAPAGTETSASLSVIARDAIDLLAGAGDGRLRRCEGPHCSLLFHDDSRPGTRRWCTTARCGNKVNTKAYRDRRRRGASDRRNPTRATVDP
ncbi:MAG: CGNR zinc finger domain-containing protein [Acidimicrobiales bacterium]